MTVAIRRRIAVRPLAHRLRPLITVGSFEVVPALRAVGGGSPPLDSGPADFLDGCSIDHHRPGSGVGTRGSTGSAAPPAGRGRRAGSAARPRRGAFCPPALAPA